MARSSLGIWFTSLLVLSASIHAVQHRSYRQKRADVCPNTNGNACLFVQCENGAQCLEDPTTTDCYRCECLVGFTGPRCGTPTALLPAGCSPGCQNGVCNVNVCVCTAGYAGTFCETRIDYCLPTNPCANGGRCTSTGTTFVCDCTATGYTGQLCTVPPVTNPCASLPCQNGGQCAWDGVRVSCGCVNGYTGTYCGTPPDPCRLVSCENGGFCEVGAGNTPQCRCLAGFTGARCEVDILTNHICVQNPQSVCFNGGTCNLNGGVNDYVCKCPTGWTGTNCQTSTLVNTCSPNFCGAHGSCVEASIATGTIAVCLCDGGWSGRLCDMDVNGCPSGYCLSGGQCRMAGGAPYCDCPALYTGARCETPPGTTTTTTTTTAVPVITQCPVNPCENGGTCNIVNGNLVCTCAPNWTGPTCSTLISPITTTTTTTTTAVPVIPQCPVNPCENGGTCNIVNGNLVCRCAPNWTGPTCSTLISPITTTTTTTTTAVPVITQCPVNPCRNGGTCDIVNGNLVCTCAPNWTGPTCLTLISPITTTTTTTTTTAPMGVITCASNPCRNGGTCVPVGASFSCFCGLNTIYTGKNCDSTTPMPTNECPLNCAPGRCIFSGYPSKPYACLWNGVMRPQGGTTA